MKKLVYFVFLFSLFINSQELSSLFDNRTFELLHFLKDDVVVEFDASFYHIENHRNIPDLTFSFNKNENLLKADIFAYCRDASFSYEIHKDYLAFKTGFISPILIDCGSDEQTDFLDHLFQGIIYYEFTSATELVLYKNENHKLVFEEKTLSTKDFDFSQSIHIYPNPSSKLLQIKISNDSYLLLKCTVIDSQGRVIFIKSEELDSIDISDLSNGIYFLKIETKDNLSTVKRFIKS